MLERHGPSEKPHHVDPKDRLFNFTVGLFERLDESESAVSKTENSKAITKKTFVTLDDGSEVGLTYHTILPETSDETDLITLVHRKKDRTGKINDFLYGIDATAVGHWLAGDEDVPDHKLGLIMNTAAEGEVQFTPPEAVSANVPMLDILLAEVEHVDTHNADSEAIMDKVLGEAMRRPEDAWHNNWTIEKTA